MLICEYVGVTHFHVCVSSEGGVVYIIGINYRVTVEQGSVRLKALEAENTSLHDQLEMMNTSLSAISRDREELRDMNDRSSAELRKALEVSAIRVYFSSKPTTLTSLSHKQSYE